MAGASCHLNSVSKTWTRRRSYELHRFVQVFSKQMLLHMLIESTMSIVELVPAQQPESPVFSLVTEIALVGYFLLPCYKSSLEAIDEIIISIMALPVVEF